MKTLDDDPIRTFEGDMSGMWEIENNEKRLLCLATQGAAKLQFARFSICCTGYNKAFVHPMVLTASEKRLIQLLYQEWIFMFLTSISDGTLSA